MVSNCQAVCLFVTDFRLQKKVSASGPVLYVVSSVRGVMAYSFFMIKGGLGNAETEKATGKNQYC